MADAKSDATFAERELDSLKSLLAEVAGLRRRVGELTRGGHDLVNAQASLESLLHRVTDAIIRFEPDGTISSFNRTAERIFGYAEGTMIGQTGDCLFNLPPRFAGDVPAYLLDYSRNTLRQYDQPLIGIRNDSTQILLEVSVADVAANAPLLFEDVGRKGNASGEGDRAFLCILRDITERKRIDDELRLHREHLEQLVAEQISEIRAAKEEAEHANRVKSEFLAKISHELRTPMHAILSYSEFGLKKFNTAPPEKLTQYFSRINTAGSRLLDMIDELLDLAKAEAGREVYDMQVNDLHAVITSIAREYEALAELHGVSLILNLRLADARVVMDGRRMEQVIRNLISNAFKFSPQGGRVELTTNATVLRDEDGSVDAVQVMVCDQGDGIPEDELDRVFNKFVQGSRNQDGSKGTGLGLAISREIVQAHRGRITASNAADGGACFELVFPRDAG